MGLNDVYNQNSPSGIDPADAYAWAGWSDDEGERKVTTKGVPAFPFYVLHVDKAEAAYTTGAAKMPLARLAATVKEGPVDTLGRKVFFDIFLDISPNTVAEDGITKIAKTDAELSEGYRRLDHVFNRLARIGKFAMKRPASRAKVHLDQYVGQFNGGGFDFIADVRQDKNTGRNSVWPDSLAALDDPAFDKKLAAQGKKALDEARAEIEKVNKIAETGQAGRTAGSLKRPAGLNG